MDFPQGKICTTKDIIPVNILDALKLNFADLFS